MRDKTEPKGQHPLKLTFRQQFPLGLVAEARLDSRGVTLRVRRPLPRPVWNPTPFDPGDWCNCGAPLCRPPIPMTPNRKGEELNA
jgi:hypothetical protein